MEKDINGLIEMEVSLARSYFAMLNSATKLTLDTLDILANGSLGRNKRQHPTLYQGADLNDHYGRRHTDVDVTRL